ncbi:hypothetical protein [Tautonia sociabilis]|uniref:YkgJ family cysteine cluster protein n=1 Tax=Tautonia sociabilis TaxID=2080755 RepID=A0A432MJ65_9BACT|nr:hypothetical protein [Tautonia sociabilis]RUL87196.1 hypothetical protein TsocGM_13280 [Tautonia sociabilis]
MPDDLGEQPEETGSPAGEVSARVGIKVGGAEVAFTLSVPSGTVGPEVLLPIARGLEEIAERVAEEAVERSGKAISCAKGCGACCRQLVPISPLEAHQLRELVASLPKPRRSEVRDRFTEAIRRLGEAGLLEAMRDPGAVPVADCKRFALDYFD